MSLVVLPQTQHASQTAPDSAAEQLMSLHKYPEPVQVRRPLQSVTFYNYTLRLSEKHLTGIALS